VRQTRQGSVRQGRQPGHLNSPIRLLSRASMTLAWSATCSMRPAAQQC
jgi:hypothetical protein